MARGALGCLTVLSSALQLENFLEWAPMSWLEMEYEKLFASQSRDVIFKQQCSANKCIDEVIFPKIVSNKYQYKIDWQETEEQQAVWH